MTKQVTIEGTVDSVDVYRILIGLQHEINTSLVRLHEFEERLGVLANSLLKETDDGEATEQVCNPES